MKYLKTTSESKEYKEVQGYENGNDKLELIEDADGNWFTNSGNKSNPAFKEILDSLNAMDETDDIDFKIDE